ncbi:hypothetical protein AVEN_169859-1 [Araneus ventricosus]|uniref:Uncharacterized protein n=1 Tax=Araneus ventricosus TaxID=182803 RepID=A0A4Y2VXV1_ARAVE|nr:hypothetical protein AVEN_47743-1 [Araneus ventricosus]GBO29153.1 hypothetical protein AVEN_85030-1 [Araneus ventricosus]GBO29155.1 hypothetical protein AVEN_155809-1 [Araneus ventricosus]GBO29158.1 hypothetical protein AVEN_169859-1 [Araneus ventricosus]
MRFSTTTFVSKSVTIPRGRGGLVVRSRLWGRRVPIPTKIRRVWGLLHSKSHVVAKHPLVSVAWKLGEGVPAQVSSSSSDRGLKLRGPSQNSPRVASKRDVNMPNNNTVTIHEILLTR